MNQPIGGLSTLVRRIPEAIYTDEYNCKLRRLYPWPGRVETKRPLTEFGVIWVVLEPGKAVDAHDHDEEETFIVIEGQARLTLNGEEVLLSRGDVAYIPRFARHQLHNVSDSRPFAMIDIYWDWRGRSQPDAQGEDVGQ